MGAFAYKKLFAASSKSFQSVAKFSVADFCKIPWFSVVRRLDDMQQSSGDDDGHARRSTNGNSRGFQDFILGFLSFFLQVDQASSEQLQEEQQQVVAGATKEKMEKSDNLS